MTDLRRVTAEAAMALAINLEIVGPDEVDDFLNHRGRGVRADVGVLVVRVEVEVDAEETLRALEPLRRRVGSARNRNGGEKECG
jgi:hypothetical protein